MEHPGLAVVMTLVHGIHPQIAWPATRIGFTPFGNAHLPRLGVVHADARLR